MPDLLKALANATLTTSSSNVYTAPASTRTIIKSITLCNMTATARHATVNVNSGSIVFQYPVPAYDTLVLRDIGLILEAGQHLAALAEANSAIRIVASGLEVS